MKLGVFAKTFEGDTPAEVLHAARSAGYQAVQYNMACSGLGSLPLVIPEPAADAIAAASNECGVEISAVSATYNMVHPDMTRRNEGRRSFEAIAASARRMGCELVTVCSGSCDPIDQWRSHPDNETEGAWREMVAEFRRLVAIAECHNVHIGVEPELANVVSSAAKARALLDLFPSAPIRIVFDPANLFEAKDAVRAADIVDDALDMLGDDIALAHAKDRHANGNFATAGQGVVDWKRYFAGLRRAEYSGAIITHGLKANEAEDVARFLHRELASFRGE
jgi:sugar phosphate isomerase/epimerase